MSVVMALVHRIAGLNLLQYTGKVLAPCALLFVLSLLAFYFISESFDVWYIKAIVTGGVLLIELGLWFFVAIGKWERSQLINLIKRR